jgi:hypothetical protein
MVIVDSSGRILTRQAAKANTRLDADARTAAVPNVPRVHPGVLASGATPLLCRFFVLEFCCG